MRSLRWRANRRDFPRLSALIGLSKISRSDPSLTAFCGRVCDPNHSCRSFTHQIELASSRPPGGLDLDRWIDFSAICFDTLLRLIIAEIHI